MAVGLMLRPRRGLHKLNVPRLAFKDDPSHRVAPFPSGQRAQLRACGTLDPAAGSIRQPRRGRSGDEWTTLGVI